MVLQRVAAFCAVCCSVLQWDESGGRSNYDKNHYCVAASVTAAHCNTLQHTATHRNKRQHTANLAQCVSFLAGVRPPKAKEGADTLQHTAAHYSTPQHTAAHCNTLQHTAPSLQCVSLSCRCPTPEGEGGCQQVEILKSQRTTKCTL